MVANRNFPQRPRIGWLCPYAPIELILAAGLEPIRLWGRVERIKEADGRLIHNFCPFLKNVLDSVLTNEYADVDGLILAHSCDGVRRLTELMPDRPPFIYFLDLPKNADDNGLKYYASRLADLKAKLESEFGTGISTADLNQAISTTNERRQAMLSLFEGQRAVPAPAKGSDLWALCQGEAAGTNGDFEAAVEVVKSTAGKGPGPDSPRIMIVGTVLDRPVLFEMVEEAGGEVVVFDTCHGLPHYAFQIDDGPDPIASLARGYLNRPRCARWPDFGARHERILGLVDEYSIDGIIHAGLTHCDYSLFETPNLASSLKKKQTPLLVLENDYLWSDAQRIKTRVEAFLEMVSGAL